MKYNKLINNLSDINSAFSKLTSEEMIAIEQVSQNQNISDDEWQNILKKAKKSQPLLLSLCYFDNYNQNIVQKLIDMLPTDSLTYVLHKNNIDISSVKYVCSKIKNTDLKEYIENNSDNISEIFKNEILNFDYEKSQAINFAQYQFFRGIDVQATQMIELYPTDENYMTAISNNKYLDDKIRNDAFNNMHNPSLIENYTNYMKMNMYHNAAIRLFDYPQKSVMDIEKNEEAKEVILKLIEKRELPLSCEYDLLQRLQDMPSLHYCGILLNTMLKHTHDAIILKKAYEFNPQTTEHIIENNPHCDIFTVEKFINKSVRKMKEFSKSNSLIPLLKEKDIVYTKIFSQPLSLESYKKIHQYAKTNDQLLDYAILVSPYININSIKDLFQNNKSPMVAFREQLQHQFAQHGIYEKRCF